VADDMERAKESIYISDWWFYPLLYLKRAESGQGWQKTRIDQVLQRKAEQGVQVRLIMWKNPMLDMMQD
jgi:phosphatidylserine/phosphatidylglycerophosphate/cardiolipin synthase-like enzyme